MPLGGARVTFHCVRIPRTAVRCRPVTAPTYQPLSTKDKFRLAVADSFDIYAYPIAGIFAAVGQAQKVPALMRKLVGSGARGVSNARGFYHYTATQARRWEELFLKFSYEIRALAQKYPENIGN
jgi:hypothetical protein